MTALMLTAEEVEPLTEAQFRALVPASTRRWLKRELWPNDIVIVDDDGSITIRRTPSESAARLIASCEASLLPELPDMGRRGYRQVRRLATPPWADRDEIAAIYRKARHLSRKTGVPHHVDHEIPLQGRTVCGLHVETNLRVITARDNLRRRRVYRP